MRQKQWDASVIQEVSEWRTDKLDWFYFKKDLLAIVWFYMDGIPSRIVSNSIYCFIVSLYECDLNKGQVTFYAVATVYDI